MPSATRKDHLQATAQVLRQAIAAYPGTIPEIARRIGKSPATLHLWSKGYHSVSRENARALAKVLGIDPGTIASARLDDSRGQPRKGKPKRGKAGRPPGSPHKTTNGPAARAVALLEARSPVLVTAQPANGVQGASRAPREGGAPGVFRMEARADGTVAIWVQTVYPMEKGAQFVRWLLDFGVLPAPPDPPPTG
jgi:transcriptional regulator with XRE-family HTH domain